MKQAARTLNIIANVFNVIALILVGILIIIVAVGKNLPDEEIAKLAAEANTTIENYRALLTVSLVILIVVAIILIVSIILALVANRSITRGDNNLAPHIILLVVGVISGNLFYILSGAFGIASVDKKEA